MAVATHRHPSRRTAFRSVLGAASLAALSLPLMLVGTAQAQAPQPVTALPSVPTAVEPGAGTIPAPDGTVWTDVDGDPIKAHGGSVVRVEESVVGLDITGDGTTEDEVYLWYGEDKTNATRPVDGVRGYWSTDLVDWHDMGRVLPSHQHFTLRVNDEGTAVEVDPERVEEIKQTANLTAPTGDVTQEEIDAARDFVEPYVTAWADEEAGIAAEYDEANLANASYRLNGNINIMERPKMLYNELTGKFVIIYHADGPLPDNPDLVEWVRDGGRRENQNVGSRYSRAEVGFAVSDTPWGPFRLVNTTKLNWADGVPNPGREGDSRDMTVFQDAGTRTVDPSADDAYVVYSSEMNKWMYISRLNAEYTGPLAEGNEAVLGQDFSNRVLPDFSREASAVLKYDGYYYMLTSGTDGWASTPVIAYRSPAMITDTEAVVGDNNRHPSTGQWERLEIVNPCVGVASRDGVGTADPTRCFDSQPTFAISLDQDTGQFIYMGDRWVTEANGSAGERSRYVWAPIQVDSDTRQVTVENVGAFDPANASLYAPLVPAEPLVFQAEVEDRDTFAPTFDVTVAGRSYTDVTVEWTPASLDAAFATPGTHRIEGHVTGSGATADLDGRYVEAAVVVGGLLDVCRLPGTSVSASFFQTDWETMPPSNACDGNPATTWSTWASNNGHPGEATFTAEFDRPWTVGEVSLQNTEGSPTGVTVEWLDGASGQWTATSAGTTPLAPNGTVTTVSFDSVVTSAIRLTVHTPGTYLKISEITIPAAAPDNEAEPVLPESVEVSGPATVRVGETATLSAAVVPQDADQAVEWSSSDESVATVDVAGVVTGVAAGEVTVTATSVGVDEVSAAHRLVVLADDAEPGDAEPGDAPPDDAEPGGGEPGDGEPGAESGDGESGDDGGLPATGAAVGGLIVLATTLVAAGALVRKRRA